MALASEEDCALFSTPVSLQRRQLILSKQRRARKARFTSAKAHSNIIVAPREA
jgi:hypothetical protein